MQVKTFEVPIFNVEFTVINSTDDELDKWLSDRYANWSIIKESTLGTIEPDLSGLSFDVDGDMYVWINSLDVNVYVIMHELLHTVYAICNKVGIDITDQEVICYLQEYLFELVTEWLSIQCTVMDPTKSPSTQEDEVQLSSEETI